MIISNLLSVRHLGCISFVIAGLSGCLGTTNNIQSAASAVALQNSATTIVNNTSFVLRAPKSHCFDATNSQQFNRYSFVIFQPCDASSQGGVLTMSIGPTKNGDQHISEIQKFFESDTGRAALTPSRKPQNTEILQTFRQNDILYFKIKDASGPRIKSTATTTWRSVFQVSGFIFSGSFLPTDQSTQSDSKSLKLIHAFTQNVRRTALKRSKTNN